MDWIKKHYDRAFVIVAALIALVGSGWLILKASGFRAQFVADEKTPGTRKDTPSDDLVTSALKRLTVQPWDRPRLGAHKSIPLLASTPFVVLNDKPGEPFDMLADNAPKLRDPVENWWLVENDLDFTLIDVLNDDPDRDGYSNLDEWVGKTNPNSSISQPPFDTKLYYADRIAEPLVLKLSSVDNGACSIAFTTKDDKGEDLRKNEYGLKVGDTSKFGAEPGGPGRFKVISLSTEKVVKFNTPTVVAVAVLKDLKEGGEDIRLVQGENVDHPTFKAKIIYTRDNKTFEVKKGGDFEIAHPAGTTITVLDITPDQITIKYPDPAHPDKDIKKSIKFNPPRNKPVP